MRPRRANTKAGTPFVEDGDGVPRSRAAKHRRQAAEEQAPEPRQREAEQPPQPQKDEDEQPPGRQEPTQPESVRPQAMAFPETPVPPFHQIDHGRHTLGWFGAAFLAVIAWLAVTSVSSLWTVSPPADSPGGPDVWSSTQTTSTSAPFTTGRSLAGPYTVPCDLTRRWVDFGPERTFYAILGVEPYAEQAEIKSGYMRCAEKMLFDGVITIGEGGLAQAKEECRKLTVLSLVRAELYNEATRRNYDGFLREVEMTGRREGGYGWWEKGFERVCGRDLSG